MPSEAATLALASLSPHRQLREATGSAHAALEAEPLMRDLLCGPLEPGDYVRVLRAHRAAYRHIDTALLAGDEAYQPRVPLLDADLADCGADAHDMAYTPTSCLSDDRSSAALLGMRYVVDGSLLGGTVILRMLHRLLPSHPHRFFAFGQQQPASWWRSVQRRLDAQLAEPAALEHAISAAQATFALFRHAFDENRA